LGTPELKRFVILSILLLNWEWRDMMKMTIEQLGVRIQKLFNDGVETTARKCKFVERSATTLEV
jgi:hypothetical protein